MASSGPALANDDGGSESFSHIIEFEIIQLPFSYSEWEGSFFDLRVVPKGIVAKYVCKGPTAYAFVYGVHNKKMYPLDTGIAVVIQECIETMRDAWLTRG